MTRHTLQIGCADFREPTLLILGEPVSLNWLSDCIETRQLIDFGIVPFVNQVNINLLLESTEDKGILTRQDKNFLWKISLIESQEFSAKLRSLAVAKMPSHIYLDPTINSAGVEVVASIGEYSEAVFTKNGTDNKADR